MHYVGLDVHWRQSTYCVLDENGKHLTSRTIHGPWEKVLAALSSVKKPFAICFEASTGYGWLYDRLKGLAARVAVAHPGELRMIFRSKQKNDRVDAEKLAKVLFLDEVPPVYVPEVEVRSWRGMIEHRSGLLADRTGAKNELRALLRSHGVVAPKGLWTLRGLAWIRGLEFEQGFDSVRRDILLEKVEAANKMIKRVEVELAKVAAKHPGVQLLMTIPGVGIRTAEAVMAYIDRPERFHSNRSIGEYFGIVPSQDSSGGRERLGHITKQGPATVRRLVVEAAWQSIRHSPAVRARFERIMGGNAGRKKIALVAVAHYLLRVMLAMLKSGEGWRKEAA